MALAFVSFTQSEDTVGTSVTVAMPATRPADDFYLFVITRDDDDFTFDANADIAELVDFGNGSGLDASLFVGWKKGEASEPASYEVTTTGGTGERSHVGVFHYSGQHDTTPIGNISSVNSGTGTQATANAITATSADSIILRVYGVNTRYFDTFSAGTERGSYQVATSGYANYSVVEEASPGNGASTGTATADIYSTFSDGWMAVTIEIMPAAGGGSIIPQIMHNRRMQQ